MLRSTGYEDLYSRNIDGDESPIDGDESPLVTEETSLLTSISYHTGHEVRSNKFTYFMVGLMSLVFVSGIAIGIYLLVLQNNEENILPPVNKWPIHQVNKSDWDPTHVDLPSTQPFQANTVVIEQTDTRECRDLESCLVLLKEIKASFSVNDSLPYNFLLSSDGTAYEALGWSGPPPLLPESLVLSFIGNFTDVPPVDEQMELAKSLISVSISKDLLNKNYTVIGKRTKEDPKFLFEKIKDIEHLFTIE
ncbi:peptidoglycan-recognition protein SB2 [Bicyclus anynana]|uniref:Peptidoglycan-recognition protein SB2-like isoform X4 n=1 Tax=Bicyclus anynana TaxID=110368 RepID=A0A6J1N0Y0_BICAN|nr:peptidoglycan-recognition protein SB2 [Bicyclus anynana]XP_023938709.1 peptidoglycan-recognition protein SB2 [Bicyclus anynana]